MAKVLLFAATVSIARICFGAEVAFDEVTSHYAKFNHKRITVRGLADVGGAEFALWRDAGALKHADLKKYLCVDVSIPRNAKKNPYEYANLHFVKITGVVDTSIHCSLGADPFAIHLEHVEVLPGDRLRQFLPVLGFFRNDSLQTITIRTSWGATSLGVAPRRIDCFAIKKGTVTATTLSGKPFAHGEIVPPRDEDPYYDRKLKAYYYRITHGHIEPVLPKNAKGWSSGYTIDRD